MNPMTGFFRDGCCDTGQEDIGSHTVCAAMTAGFLEFSRSCGNDFSTPMPEFGFLGLKPGDRWCLCPPRWQEALEAGPSGSSDWSIRGLLYRDFVVRPAFPIAEVFVGELPPLERIIYSVLESTNLFARRTLTDGDHRRQAQQRELTASN
jgi:hypothetical protein